MPPRHNLFQDVVAIIERHKASDAVVCESAALIDCDTGKEREVDVTVTSTVDGEKFVMSLEAADRRRRADVPWVEQLIIKHQALETNQLVLIAAAGFYGPALAKAAAHRVVTITPEDLPDDEHEFAVIAKLATPPITVEPKLAGVAVRVDNPPGTTMVGEPVSIRHPSGAAVDLEALAYDVLDRRFQQLLADVAGDLTSSRQIEVSVSEPPPEVLVAKARFDGSGEVVDVPVAAIEIDVVLDVQLHPEMNMAARLFDTTATLAGETTLGDAQAVFVATQDAGATRATLRTRQPGEQTPEDWEYDGEFEITPRSDG